MKNGYVKVAAITPHLRLADPVYNTTELIRLTKEADNAGVSLAVFPELCITGATCGDLFFSDTLIKNAQDQLLRFLKETEALETVAILGLPVGHCNKLYNCAAVCLKGDLIALIPKTTLSNDEKRMFASSEEIANSQFTLYEKDGCRICHISSEQVFRIENCSNFTFAVEIGNDTLASVSPASALTEAGAHIICSPAAIAQTVVSSDIVNQVTLAHASCLNAAYVVASAGIYESTSDRVYGGHRMICENGTLLAQALPFSDEEMLISEIDVDMLAQERRKNANRFGMLDTRNYTLHDLRVKLRDTKLTRGINPHPFIPADAAARAERCERILNIQAHGLKERMTRAYVKKAVIGISGGLDSTLALLAAVRAVDLLKRPRTDILAVTMPCFGTTKRTKSNATVLCEELGVDFRCVNIADAVNQHFKDICHDPSIRNVTYENSQARERTQVLMDIANDCGGMVIGTGDLSELALGWATYNGDHMSMYGVNGAIPKTLIRHIVAYCADCYEAEGNPTLASALRDILDTPVSPELLPAEESGQIAQKTEDLVGPYELHDFYIYYLLRYGFSPKKLYRIAKHALGNAYSNEELLKWLEILVRRFFAQQFKRSCLPDGPSVGSVSLSPRGGWMMPSDATSTAWLKEIEEIKAEENNK